jgi:hypothetical protein
MKDESRRRRRRRTRPGAFHLGLWRPGEYEWPEYME